MLLLQLSCLLSLGLCVQASNRAFSARNRQGKNSRLLSWAPPTRGAAPISLYRSTPERARSGGGRRQPKYAALLQNILATNQAEVARENDKLLERRLEQGRRGKEGEDLLVPPYNSDFDQGQIQPVGSGQGLGAGARQAEEEDAGSANAADRGEEEVRCIKKVMQVEETVWDTKVRCEHRFSEKCHDTYITDYTPTQERKCETSFKKNCHITYKPVMYLESVSVCSEPLERVCSNTTVGEEICRTHYQTTCETRFKAHEVEQDEPVCKMVVERKCRDVQVPVSAVEERRRRRNGEEERRRRQSGEEELLSLGQECEDWPVQKCTLEKKTVNKVNPDTSCRKIPREICAPSNCEFLPAEKVCRDEEQELVQNIPTEDCNLEPQEDCRMETVLVPRLVLKPNCIKVPKEICSEAKVNPRKVSKPVIREWCYRPSDLRNPGSRLQLSRIFQG